MPVTKNSTPKTDEKYILEADELTVKLSYPSVIGSVNLQQTTQAVAQEFYNTAPQDSGILPPVIRYVADDFSQFVIERPPSEVTIRLRIGNAKTSAQRKEWRVNMPWLIYVFHLNANFAQCVAKKIDPLQSFRIFARPSQLMSEEDELYHPVLPNLYLDGRVCLNTSDYNVLHSLGYKTDIPQFLNAYINNYWAGLANLDLYENIAGSYRPKELICDASLGLPARASHTFDTLAKMSTQEVLDLSYVKHMPNNRTLVKIIESISPSNIANPITDPFFGYLYHLLFNIKAKL